MEDVEVAEQSVFPGSNETWGFKWLHRNTKAELAYACSNVRGHIQKFPDGRLERELQMVQVSITRRGCIAIL
jgi:hypothetical protein